MVLVVNQEIKGQNQIGNSEDFFLSKIKNVYSNGHYKVAYYAISVVLEPIASLIHMTFERHPCL